MNKERQEEKLREILLNYRKIPRKFFRNNFDIDNYAPGVGHGFVVPLRNLPHSEDLVSSHIAYGRAEDPYNENIRSNDRLYIAHTTNPLGKKSCCDLYHTNNVWRFETIAKLNDKDEIELHPNLNEELEKRLGFRTTNFINRLERFYRGFEAIAEIKEKPITVETLEPENLLQKRLEDSF